LEREKTGLICCRACCHGNDRLNDTWANEASSQDVGVLLFVVTCSAVRRSRLPNRSLQPPLIDSATDAQLTSQFASVV